MLFLSLKVVLHLTWSFIQTSIFTFLFHYRHHVNHFISALQQYVQSQLSYVSWCKFLHSLKYKVWTYFCFFFFSQSMICFFGFTSMCIYILFPHTLPSNWIYGLLLKMIVENNLVLFPICNFPLDFEALYFGSNYVHFSFTVMWHICNMNLGQLFNLFNVGNLKSKWKISFSLERRKKVFGGVGRKTFQLLCPWILEMEDILEDWTCLART